jgi:hypothetical protein
MAQLDGGEEGERGAEAAVISTVPVKLGVHLGEHLTGRCEST